MDKDYTEYPECYTSGLEEACHPETPDVLRKLKPDPNHDDLSRLLHNAAIWSRKATLEYLLGVGANPNDKANGGSSALDRTLWHLSFTRLDLSDTKRLKPKYQLREPLDCVRLLLTTDRWDYDELVTHEPAGKLVLAIQASM